MDFGHMKETYSKKYGRQLLDTGLNALKTATKKSSSKSNWSKEIIYRNKK